MKEYKKRFIKALICGVAFILFIVISSILTKENPFKEMPWYMVPILLLVTFLYGTGWYFAFNLLKRSLRKFLRVNADASIWQALTGKGLIVGFFYAMICLVVGCFLSFVIGNFFMVADFILAKKNKAPLSIKYKFDGDGDYDSSAAIRGAVEYSDAASNASAKQRLENQQALRDIEEGKSAVVTTEVKEGGKTTIYKTEVK